MKIAYIYQMDNRWGYAAKTVANGFKNDFIARGDSFQFFDIHKLTHSFWPLEKLRLVNYAPDIIFASVENLEFMPLSLLKSTSLVLWGSFYSPCDYEDQIHGIAEKTKKTLNKYSSKHNILIWSQHDELINEKFFGGYEKELGLKFIQLLHCADKTKLTLPVLKPKFDFMWVGNVSHRQTLYNSFIAPLKKEYNNFIEYTEHNKVDPEIIETKQLYSRSFIIPNVHTEAQIKNNILLNERVFSSTIMGGFQICDNLMARKYFSDSELVIAIEASDFIEKAHYYIGRPEERLEMIKRMQTNILKNHTYTNRVDDILTSLGV